MVANLCARKGVLEFLEALAGLPSLPPYRLWIVGAELESDYAARCRAVAAAHPCLRSRLRFVGTVPPERMPVLYAQADLLVSAAAMESFGMAVREAMAAGVPVLLRSGGYTDAHLREHGAGQLLPDVRELSLALVRLLRHPASMAALQSEARRRCPPARGWDQVAAEVLEGLGRISD